MDKKTLADRKWERMQAASREEQIEIVRQHLERVFRRRFKDNPDSDFEKGREHAQMCFIANRLSKYIRPEDNSVRGFHRRFQNFNSPQHKEQFIETELAKMTSIPAPLPPQFVGLSNYDGGKRFLEINYEGTKAMVGDGNLTTTFPYYDAYSPLVDHLAVSYYLAKEKAFLGADDGEATHSLVLDTEKMKIYIATRRRAYDFLQIQLPQSPEERAAEEERMEKVFEGFEKAESLADFQKLGMFQFIAPQNDRSTEVAAMSEFLDGFIPEEAKNFIQQFYETCS